jgi:predicted phage terminase large subunit-like protein
MTLHGYSQSPVVLAAGRSDFASFIRPCFRILNPNAIFQMNWHHYALAHHLELVGRGLIRRLVVNLPRRTLKSFEASVCLPAYLLGHDPSKRIVVASYGADLAIKLSNDFRTIVNDPFYRAMFPRMQISRAKNTEMELATTLNGYRFATTIEGSLAGRGGDLLIIDDPHKPGDVVYETGRTRVYRWFCDTGLPALDDKRHGAVVLVMQRLQEDDLTGMVLRTAPGEWTVLSLPAIAEGEERVTIGADEYHFRKAGDLLHPEREPLEVLNSLRLQLGAETFAAQYQQSPICPDSLIMNQSWIQRYDQLPTRTSNSKIVQSWDTASKDGELNDYSVCVTLLYHASKYYLVDVLRERLLYPQLRERAIAHARVHQANTILIEDAGAGIHLVTELKNAKLLAVAAKPQLNKRMRMAVQLEKFKSGTILLPKQASWLANFEHELFAFPHSRYDDQIDALSQALAYEPPKDRYAGYENVDWQGLRTNLYLQSGGRFRLW